jgi:tetratricopeptide (TPR) repeat protein
VLAAKRGDGRTAVADLERVVSTLPHQLGEGTNHAAALDWLANAYLVAGDLAKARETYEQITKLTTGRLGYGATYARSFYHLGLIAERQGDKARARESFGKFLDLWKNADQGQPEVADARKRMTR